MEVVITVPASELMETLANLPAGHRITLHLGEGDREEVTRGSWEDIRMEDGKILIPRLFGGGYKSLSGGFPVVVEVGERHGSHSVEATIPGLAALIPKSAILQAALDTQSNY